VGGGAQAHRRLHRLHRPVIHPVRGAFHAGGRSGLAARQRPWGQGYATEGARASLEAGFTQLGLTEIVSITVPANTRSRRVMERIGMTRDPADDFDHPRLPEGHPLRRHVLYRIGRERWQRRGGSAQGARRDRLAQMATL
jgi:RimJ/RimL family protein N-acetyltransferase